MPPACEKCGWETRLVGCETDPESGLGDLHTYECGTCGHFQVSIEIGDGAARQARQQLLLHEMNHRTQNLIAVIQGIARLTLRNGDTNERRQFNERLMALGRAHRMLAEAAWRGASLSEILDRELAAFSNNLAATGCDVVLNPAAAQQFALIIHELATNAIKHGSLSVHSGRVAVEGRIEYGEGKKAFRFTWQEIGGPTVIPPERRGFGSSVLVQGARSFSRDVAMDFFPSGLRYELQVPMSAFVTAKALEEMRA